MNIVPISETSNVFCMLPKQGWGERRKAHPVDNLSNTQWHTYAVPSETVPLGLRKATRQKAQPRPARTNCSAKRNSAASARSAFLTQSLHLFWLVYAVLLKTFGCQSQRRMLLEPMALCWRTLFYSNMCTYFQGSEQGGPERGMTVRLMEPGAWFNAFLSIS